MLLLLGLVTLERTLFDGVFGSCTLVDTTVVDTTVMSLLCR